MASAYDIRQCKVFPEGLFQTIHFMSMVVTEIQVIVKYRSLFLGILQERMDFTLEHGIEGKVCAESNNVILLYFRKSKVKAVVGIIFVETVFSIIVLIQICQ